MLFKGNLPYEQEPESDESNCICINISLWRIHLACLWMCSSGERRNRDVFIVRIQSRILQIKGAAEIFFKVSLGKKSLKLWTSPSSSSSSSLVVVLLLLELQFWTHLRKEVHIIIHITCRLLC